MSTKAMKAALDAVQEVINSDRGKNFLNPSDFLNLVIAKAELTHALADHLRDATEMVAPPECKTEAEKTAFAFGWYKALESVRETKT